MPSHEPRITCLRRVAVLLGALTLSSFAADVSAYPGGTPQFQTDVAPFCAACHASVSESDLAGGGDYALKQLAERKHIAPILEGSKAYSELGTAEREQLVAHIRAIDAASSVEVAFPKQVVTGETFEVTVTVAGGAGPAVGIALVDRAHRWFARPASASGWQVVGAPKVFGPEGEAQGDWLAKRPEALGRGITYVNVTGIRSDAARGKWATAKVVFTLRAPLEAGSVPLVGAYFYGTEKASPLGAVKNPLGYVTPRGGYTGASGRVRFSEERSIRVVPPALGPPGSPTL